MSNNPEDDLELLTDGPQDADWTLILAHGAGQGMDSSFITHIAGALGRTGVRVVRFEFPYMAEMRRAPATAGRRTGSRCCWSAGTWSPTGGLLPALTLGDC
jgi:predicted alpha/beta-hydrolase family hydrolase